MPNYVVAIKPLSITSASLIQWIHYSSTGVQLGDVAIDGVTSGYYTIGEGAFDNEQLAIINIAAQAGVPPEICVAFQVVLPSIEPVTDGNTKGNNKWLLLVKAYYGSGSTSVSATSSKEQMAELIKAYLAAGYKLEHLTLIPPTTPVDIDAFMNE